MKLFCLSGDITRPGLYELPFGVTLRELIFDLGGGIRDNNILKAVLLGGAAGSFATPEHLDIPMTFEHLQAAGLQIGSGVVIVFDDTRELGSVLAQIARFFVHESCGQCFPCRIGTEQLNKLIDKINSGNGVLDDLEKIEKLCDLMRTTSLCGLGLTAPNPFESALRFFRHEIIPYVENESLTEAA
jgi:NADH:ubiquinone oxidoreductase subunit F (NADH-binding)